MKTRILIAQQAHDTLMSYLTRTLDRLPAGTVIDATRYGSAGSPGTATTTMPP